MRPAIVGILVVCLSGCVEVGFQDPATALSEGEAALARADYAAANDHFTGALVAVGASDAQQTKAYRGRGAARQGLDRFDEAIEDMAPPWPGRPRTPSFAWSALLEAPVWRRPRSSSRSSL